MAVTLRGGCLCGGVRRNLGPKMTRIAAPILLFVLSWPAAGLDLRPAFDAQARHLIENRAAVGFVVGIFKDGETQVVGYGETKKGSGALPDGGTVYEIGSITKTFTATLLADMMLRGLVKLDTPFYEYLPPSVRVPLKDGRPITLEHLVTHTSGYPRWPENMNSVDRRNPHAAYTVELMYEFLNWYKLRRPPGTYEYSNFAFGLLGHILSLRAGEPFDRLLVERICAPLGMLDTMHSPNADMLRRLAPPYDDVLRPVGSMDLAVLGGAGGIRSTVNDMLKYMRAHLADDGTPLSRAMRLTHVRHYTSQGGKGELAKGQGIGLTWRMSRDDKILFHAGTTTGYHGWMAFVPSRGVGIVVLANGNNYGNNLRIDPFADRILHLMRGDRKEKAPEPAGAD
jgi:serine-type D-Ala-D-Ala carboxypeptidase/endopeptidase